MGSHLALPYREHKKGMIPPQVHGSPPWRQCLCQGENDAATTREPHLQMVTLKQMSWKSVRVDGNVFKTLQVLAVKSHQKS